jgi:hypothetical protein
MVDATESESTSWLLARLKLSLLCFQIYRHFGIGRRELEKEAGRKQTGYSEYRDRL